MMMGAAGSALLLLCALASGDDTELLDTLAARGGLITLQPRTYHHTGDWLLRRNRTVVQGAGVGLTKLVMHRGTVLAQDNRSDGYSHQYTYDKPLTNIVLADFEVQLVQNHTLDADGHCCTFNESRSAVQLINVAHGELRGLRVSGASFQSISLVNCAGVRVIDCHSSWCSGEHDRLQASLLTRLHSTRSIHCSQAAFLITPMARCCRDGHRDQRLLDGLQPDQPPRHHRRLSAGHELQRQLLQGRRAGDPGVHSRLLNSRRHRAA
jgi:hypothetical protein